MPDPPDILRLKECPQCGYDLGGLPREHACPECGFSYHELLDSVYVRRPRWIPTLGLRVIIAVVAMIVILIAFEWFGVARASPNVKLMAFIFWVGLVLILPRIGQWHRSRRELELLLTDHGICKRNAGTGTRSSWSAMLRFADIKAFHVDVNRNQERCWSVIAERGELSHTLWAKGVVARSRDAAESLELEVQRRIRQAWRESRDA